MNMSTPLYGTNGKFDKELTKQWVDWEVRTGQVKVPKPKSVTAQKLPDGSVRININE